tara:strand:+ start:496 stop:828 length:333 start_codon:yes stop_codon:yes gene_type:complete
MIFKTILIVFFICLFFYGLIRPFSSIFSRFFIIFGSILATLSIGGEYYAQMIANFMGVGRAADLYLYLGLITIFLFIGFTLNKLDLMNKRISKLIKEIALNESSKSKDDS